VVLEVPKKFPEFLQHALHVVYGVVIALSFDISRHVVIPISNILVMPVNTGILILGYFIIVTSWIGFFKSVKDSPHRENKYGIMRFGVDLFIVYLFFYMVGIADPQKDQSNHKDVFVWILPVMYGTFLLWDLLKFKEYKNERTKHRAIRKRRIKITINYFLIFLAISALYQYSIATISIDKLPYGVYQRDVAGLAVAGILTFMYRRAKWNHPQVAHAKRRRRRKITKSKVEGSSVNSGI
jgi:hypothetical protein